MLLNTRMNAKIHLVMNSFGTLFHDKIFSLTVNIPDISLTCFKFPGISRFSRQVVTLQLFQQAPVAKQFTQQSLAHYQAS